MTVENSAHPLRPYYDAETFNGGYPAVYRPGIGVVIDSYGNTISSKLSSFSKSNRFGSNSGSNFKYKTFRDLAKVNDFNESFKKNVYSDLEIGEYFDFNNITELIKSLVNSFIQSYIRSLVTQPFEVARLLLQVADFSNVGVKTKKIDERTVDDDNDDDDDDEEIDYFQPKDQEDGLIHTRTSTPSTRKPKPTKPVKNSEEKTKLIQPVSLHTLDIMSSLLNNEGIRGLWRANNATFIFNALSVTLEAWFTGFLSPFLQIPDPFFVDAIHSPDPTTTLILSISASVITSLLLAPLDVIRTKLIVSSIVDNERSIRNSIKNLNFFTCPISLIIPTVLNSLTNQIFKKFTPYLLYFKLGIDIYGSNIFYNFIRLGSSILELFIKLPVETLLRRSQLQYLLKESHDFNQLKIKREQLIIKPVEFKGILRTFYEVFYNKQNGIEGLFRGWRVGVLSIIGTWGVNILQVNYEDQINKTEKF